MSEVLELNREEISRLSRMDDSYGHAWALYLILKKNMDIYTGLVQVESVILDSALADKLKLEVLSHQNLIKSLINAEVILDYLSTNNTLSVKLPIALSETCLEHHLRH